MVKGGLDKVKAILREGREIKEKERLERVMGEAAVVQGQRRGSRPCNTISGLAGGAARWELKCKFEVRNCGGAISSLGRKLA